MKRLAVLFIVILAAGCSALTDGAEDNDSSVPLVCGPEHTQLPCTGGVEVGVSYPFNLLTHCGIEWAYFGGRYWVPEPKAEAPSDWASIEAGTMVLERAGVAIFEANEGGGARFVPARASYRPPACE